MPQYTCPECNAVLKRAEPLPAGKKIKCPSCGTVFGPSAAAAKPVPAKAAATTPDDIDRNPYAVRPDEEGDDLLKKEKQRAAAGIVLDRFKKSKRGPAQREVVRPANFLLATGVFNGIAYIILCIVGIFPLVFRDFYSSKPAEGQRYSDAEEEGKVKKEIDPVKWRATVIQSSIIITVSILNFIWCAFVCVGAFKMHTLESYAWAMVGAIMGMFLFPFATGVWALVTLRNPVVLDGFAEKPPPQV